MCKGVELDYICPHKSCFQKLSFDNVNRGLKCTNGHFFPFLRDTEMPVFFSQGAGCNEYTATDAAIMHDNALAWLFKTFKTDEETVRNSLIKRLNLKHGETVLVTGAGAGNDIPYIKEALKGHGKIHAQDVSSEMLLAARQRYSQDASNIQICFNVSDAGLLPFSDNFFDAAYHFGGINLFPDIKAGFSEMDRVVKDGGKIVIGDEGVAPWLKSSEYAKMLICNNSLYAHDAPFHCVPENARDVRLTWELSNTFWVIEFTSSQEKLPFDMHVPHLGKRGGSIYTRYFGQLEGIDPLLCDALKNLAQKKGVSQVSLLENILSSALKD